MRSTRVFPGGWLWMGSFSLRSPTRDAGSAFFGSCLVSAVSCQHIHHHCTVGCSTWQSMVVCVGPVSQESIVCGLLFFLELRVMSGPSLSPAL
jgi:hypothetical protein